MGRRTYNNGVLVEEWDDDALTYRRHDDGDVVEERPYTTDEAQALAPRKPGCACGSTKPRPAAIDEGEAMTQQPETGTVPATRKA